MGIYLYENPKTGRVVEVVQGMNDVHEFTDEQGIKYARVFLSPLTSVDTKVDPWSKKDWMKRTNKHMSVGDMMDESAQLSEKRAAKAGLDPVKQKVFDAYKKKTGKNHPEDKPKKIETEHAILTL